MEQEQSILTKPQPQRLPRLSKTQRIQKRPLLHPAIAPPRSSSSTPKVVYISASTPFISTIKRVRKLLSHIESRSAGSIDFTQHPNGVLKQIEEGVKKREKKEAEEVILKATGKAIEKALRLAVWWMGQIDVRVRMKTSSVGAVDDIVNKDGEGEEEEGSRVRRTSSLEVGISLR